MAKVRLETTLGDLIVALTDEAARVSGNTGEKYHLAAAALNHLLANVSAAGNARRLQRQLEKAA